MDQLKFEVLRLGVLDTMSWRRRTQEDHPDSPGQLYSYESTALGKKG